MTKAVLAYAALLGVALSVACSSSNSQNQAQSQATPSPTPFSYPTAPKFNMSAAQPPNCAQPGPNVQLIDSATNTPIVISPNEQVVAWVPPWFQVSMAWRWTIKNLGTGALRIVFPTTRLIVGSFNGNIHDASTMEVLPLDSAADQKLFNDYVAHIQFTASRAEAARNAQLVGAIPPTPNPAAQLKDDVFNGAQPPPPPPPATAPPSEQQQLAAIDMGSAISDTDFQDSPGDPNAQDPHEYDFACAFLTATSYGLVWHRETRTQRVNNAYTSVQATLAANSAPPIASSNVGWVADKYVTYVAKPIQPQLVQLSVVTSPSPGFDVKYIKQFSFTPVACQNLAPLPTPVPSGVPPTPVPTAATCSAPPY